MMHVNRTMLGGARLSSVHASASSEKSLPASVAEDVNFCPCPASLMAKHGAAYRLCLCNACCRGCRVVKLLHDLTPATRDDCSSRC